MRHSERIEDDIWLTDSRVGYFYSRRKIGSDKISGGKSSWVGYFPKWVGYYPIFDRYFKPCKCINNIYTNLYVYTYIKSKRGKYWNPLNSISSRKDMTRKYLHIFTMLKKMIMSGCQITFGFVNDIQVQVTVNVWVRSRCSFMGRTIHNITGSFDRLFAEVW